MLTWCLFRLCLQKNHSNIRSHSDSCLRSLREEFVCRLIFSRSLRVCCCQLETNDALLTHKREALLFLTAWWHLSTAFHCCWQLNTGTVMLPMGCILNFDTLWLLFGAKRTRCQSKLTWTGYCTDQWGYGAFLLDAQHSEHMWVGKEEVPFPWMSVVSWWTQMFWLPIIKIGGVVKITLLWGLYGF